MTELIAILCASRADAEALRRRLIAAPFEDAEDAVVVAMDETGAATLDQMLTPASLSPAGVALRSMLGGLLHLHPLRGALPRATAGVLYWALDDYGLPGRFLAELSAALEPGRALLLVLARRRPAGAITAALGPAGRGALIAELNHREEGRLADALAKALAEARRLAAEASRRAPASDL